MSHNKTFIIICGIPCSGKTTYASKLAAETDAFILSSDGLRKEVTGSESDLSMDGFIWGTLMEERIKLAMLIWDKSVIFDATQVNRSARKPIVKIAKKIREMDKFATIKIVCHYFLPNVELAKRRNLERSRHVPENVIDNFARKWEVPSLDEGFDEIKLIE
jgi:predicted kinase